MPLGEADRLLTILTQEFGLVRAVAPGARKQNSKIGGRSGLFVVNELLIAKGRSLDKITQAETIESYPAISQDLGKLAASQYLAEMVMCQALSEQPQTELFYLIDEHLKRLEQLPKSAGISILAHLCHAAFHLLALAGVAPQVQACSLTGNSLTPDLSTPNWQVGFSASAGGTVSLSAWESVSASGRNSDRNQPIKSHDVTKTNVFPSKSRVAEATSTGYQTVVHKQEKLVLDRQINAVELALLQQLSQASLPAIAQMDNWLSIECILRHYVQYHFGRSIRSAALIDSYFASLPSPLTEDHATV
jgi:DNA repair protein RecO (recombination protein O)